jgi:hypothetical protein
MVRLPHLAIASAALVLVTGCSLPIDRPLWAQEVRQREAETYRVTNEQRAARLWLNQYQLIAADLTTEVARLRDRVSQCPASAPTGNQVIGSVTTRIQADLSRAPGQSAQVRADQALLKVVQQAAQADDQLEQAAATRDAGHCGEAQAAIGRLDQAFSDAQSAAAQMAGVADVPWP